MDSFSLHESREQNFNITNMINLMKIWFSKKVIVSKSTEIKGNRLSGSHDYGGGYYQQ